MEDRNTNIKMGQIYCNICNDIKKIKITTNWNDRYPLNATMKEKIK